MAIWLIIQITNRGQPLNLFLLQMSARFHSVLRLRCLVLIILLDLMHRSNFPGKCPMDQRNTTIVICQVFITMEIIISSLHNTLCFLLVIHKQCKWGSSFGAMAKLSFVGHMLILALTFSHILLVNYFPILLQLQITC